MTTTRSASAATSTSTDRWWAVGSDRTVWAITMDGTRRAPRISTTSSPSTPPYSAVLVLDDRDVAVGSAGRRPRRPRQVDRCRARRRRGRGARRRSIRHPHDAHLRAARRQPVGKRGAEGRQAARSRWIGAEDPDRRAAARHRGPTGSRKAARGTGLLRGRSVEASDLHGATTGPDGRPAQARRLSQGDVRPAYRREGVLGRSRPTRSSGSRRHRHRVPRRSRSSPTLRSRPISSRRGRWRWMW